MVDKATWDTRVKQLYKLKKSMLVTLYEDRMDAAGMRSILGGPRTKEEYIGEILRLEFPPHGHPQDD